MLGSLKSYGSRMLEASPIGYAIGATLVDRFDFVLPHEQDYHGFAKLGALFPGEVVDIGANMGHSARGIHKVLGDNRRIFSVEANPLHERKLARVRSRINMDYIIAAAHSVSNETITLYVPVYGSIVCHSAAGADLAEVKASLAAVWPKHVDRFSYRQVETRTIALDELELSPGMVKLDIQGNEMNALQGFSRTLRRCRPAVLSEFTSHEQNLMGFFADLDYRACTFDAAESRFVEFGSGPTSRNVFFLPKESLGAILQ